MPPTAEENDRRLPLRTVTTDSPTEAATYIRKGGLAAFPTETVYGLGADALNPNAVQRIFAVKGRPRDNPLIVHLSAKDQIRSVAKDLTPSATALIHAFFPGPLTIVVKRLPAISDDVTAGLDTVAIRIPGHPVALEFLHLCNCPVAAPSANRSGRPSPTSWQAVAEDFDGRIACILRGGRSPIGLESAVVDCSEPVPSILRQGAIGIEEIREVLGSAELGTGTSLMRSPGLRHRHYAPVASVHLVDAPPTDPPKPAAYIGLTVPEFSSSYELVQSCSTVAEYAHELFEFFREADRRGIRAIYCERPPADGLGRAITDRIERASRR